MLPALDALCKHFTNNIISQTQSTFMTLVLRVGLVLPLTLCHLEVSLSVCVAVHGQLGAGAGQGGGEGAACGQLL